MSEKKPKSGKSSAILAMRSDAHRVIAGHLADDHGAVVLGAEWAEVGHSRPLEGKEVFNRSLATALMERAAAIKSVTQAAAPGEAANEQGVKILFSSSETQKLLKHFNAEVMSQFFYLVVPFCAVSVCLSLPLVRPPPLSSLTFLNAFFPSLLPYSYFPFLGTHSRALSLPCQSCCLFYSSHSRILHCTFSICGLAGSGSSIPR